jgi:hypothetical protein
MGETQDEKERLVRVEEKLDMVIKKLDEKTDKDIALEARVRNLEIKNGIILTVGAGAWAVILILIGQVFGKLWR